MMLQSKDEMLGHMVMAAVEIQGYKSMTDHWGLQRWRQKHAKGKADSESQANEQALQENGPGQSVPTLLRCAPMRV